MDAVSLLYGRRKKTMIVRDIMTTKLVTVEPDDTLAHATNLFRQYHVHHLPVTRNIYRTSPEGVRTTTLICEGMISVQDIDLASASARERNNQQQPWQERRIVEVMHRALLRVTPNTSVAAAAQILVERGINCLPVIEYTPIDNETRVVLVGLVTRSDLLLALARAMGSSEPGMQLDIALPMGDVRPLARTLLLADEMHVHIGSVMATPDTHGKLSVGTLRLGTINPSPLLVRLQQEGILFSFGNPLYAEQQKQ